MRYRIELRRQDSGASVWSANVVFRYDKNGLEKKLNYSEEHFTILEEIVQDLEIHLDVGNFSDSRRPKAIVRFDDENSLSDDFAQTLSRALATLIRGITPAVDNL